MNAKCAPRREVTRGVITPAQIVGLPVRDLSERAEIEAVTGGMFTKQFLKGRGTAPAQVTLGQKLSIELAKGLSFGLYATAIYH